MKLYNVVAVILDGEDIVGVSEYPEWYESILMASTMAQMNYEMLPPHEKENHALVVNEWEFEEGTSVYTANKDKGKYLHAVDLYDKDSMVDVYRVLETDEEDIING